MKQYVLNLLIAVDQLANAMRGGFPDETLSAAAWRTEQSGKLAGIFFRPVIDFLFGLLGDKDHCKMSYESEVRNLQLPGSYRE